MPSACLDDRALLRIAGDEARGFLQGILTCNMDRVTPQAAGFGALLSPQGKILFDFLIVEEGNGFWLDTAASQIETLAKRLSMYRLRADVTITQDPSRSVMAAWDGSGVLPQEQAAPATAPAPKPGQAASKTLAAAAALELPAPAPAPAPEWWWCGVPVM